MARAFHPVLAAAAAAVAAGVAAGNGGPVASFLLVGLAVVAVAALTSGEEPAPVPAVSPAPDAGQALSARTDGIRTPVAPAIIRVLEDLPAPLLIIEAGGRVIFANRSAHALLAPLPVGGHFAHLFRAPSFIAAVEGTLADGGERNLEFSAWQGTERIFEARVVRLPEDEPVAAHPLAPPLPPMPVRVLVQLEDHTRNRRVEELRSDFIANASHELRTPLASIIGYIETLQNHARDDPSARERFLAIMAREAGRMQRLVDDLMSLSRIEMNEHVRPDIPVSLNRVAAESASALMPVAARDGVTLIIDLVPEGALVLGDRDQLAQVFTNLIDNAVKYGGRGAEVRLRVAAPSRSYPNRTGVSIADNGPGIAREHLPRLTERFYRTSVGQSRARGGTGLGLAIVKHILNRHHGRLEITSEVGRGSTFTVWLPPAPVASAAESPAAS